MAGFGSVIRFDPDHAPAQAKLGQAPAPALGGGGAMKPPGANLGAMGGGTAHLGAFANPGALKAGHLKIK